MLLTKFTPLIGCIILCTETHGEEGAGDKGKKHSPLDPRDTLRGVSFIISIPISSSEMKGFHAVRMYHHS